MNECLQVLTVFLHMCCAYQIQKRHPYVCIIYVALRHLTFILHAPVGQFQTGVPQVVALHQAIISLTDMFY